MRWILVMLLLGGIVGWVSYDTRHTIDPMWGIPTMCFVIALAMSLGRRV